MSIIFDKYIGKHLIEKTMERNNASNIASLINHDLLFYEASGGWKYLSVLLIRQDF